MTIISKAPLLFGLVFVALAASISSCGVHESEDGRAVLYCFEKPIQKTDWLMQALSNFSMSNSLVLEDISDKTQASLESRGDDRPWPMVHGVMKDDDGIALTYSNLPDKAPTLIFIVHRQDLFDSLDIFERDLRRNAIVKTKFITQSPEADPGKCNFQRSS